MALPLRGLKRTIALDLLLSLVLVGCFGGGQGAGLPVGRDASAGSAAPGASSVKHITAAIMGYPRTVRNTINAAGGAGEAPGMDIVQELLHVGMVTTDARGMLAPRLAEGVPAVENG